MKILKWIAIVFLSIIVLFIATFLIYSSLQADRLLIEKNVVIEAPKNIIYKEIANFRNWGNWSAWDKMDPDMEQVYSEKMGEIGSFNKWKSNHQMVGKGSQEVVEIRKNEYMKMAMKFEGWDATNYAEFILSETEGGTEVKWTYLGAKTPFYMNFMNTFMQPTLEENYTQSLEDLKVYIESMDLESITAAPKGVELMEIDDLAVISILDSSNEAGLSKKLAELYTELSIYLETSAEAGPNGMPLAIYHNFSPEKVVVEAALPYKGNLTPEGRVKAKIISGGKVLKGVHYGDYAQSATTHENIAKYADIKALSIKGSPWEIYANDPAEVDSALVETHIYYPIK